MSDAEQPESGGVQVDQIVVSRDDSGVIVPEEVYVEEFDDTVVVTPFNKAAKDKYIQPLADASLAAKAMFEEDIDPDDLSEEEREELKDLGRNALSDEKFAEMFNDHIVEPDLVAAYQANYPDEDIEELDERFIDQDLKAGAQDGLFFAILLASGMDEMVEGFRGAFDPEEEEGNK